MKAPFSRYKISGNSMLPTLKPGQEVLSFNWAYIFAKPKIGDMVVIEKDGREMVKRIHKVEGRKYFVQGDNTSESTDSRSFGLVNQSEILGKVILII